MAAEARTPFTESLVGSWLFVRRSEPLPSERLLYHFTADGMNHWEMDCGRERQLTALRYAFSRGTLTLFYPIGPSSDFALESEEDGSVHFVGVDGKSWWMTRLAAPLSFSKAHVDAGGRLVILHEYVPQPGPQKPTT